MTHLDFLPQFPLPANPLALFGVLLLVGALGGELTRRVLNLPRITGYVLIGLTLGASGLNVLDAKMLAYTRVFLDVGLGLVLFELGRRLNLMWLTGDRWLLVMASAESLLSFGCMFGALIWFDIASRRSGGCNRHFFLAGDRDAGRAGMHAEGQVTSAR
jgi:Kef-type K+ transport system membrane component KefB